MPNCNLDLERRVFICFHLLINEVAQKTFQLIESPRLFAPKKHFKETLLSRITEEITISNETNISFNDALKQETIYFLFQKPHSRKAKSCMFLRCGILYTRSLCAKIIPSVCVTFSRKLCTD